MSNSDATKSAGKISSAQTKPLKSTGIRDAKDDDSGMKTFVYTTLKQWILTGRLRPGIKLIPQELADALDVSRTPIRESLERLHQEGYAGRQLRRGYFVIEIAAADVHELYGVREALETYALRQALRKEISPHEILALRKINAEYAKMFGREMPMTHERLEIDRAFHLKLAMLSGNQYLCKQLDGIFEKLIFKRRADGPGPLPGEVPFRDHEDLVLALEAGDVDKAQHVLAEHTRAGCDRLLRHLQISGIERGPLKSVRARRSAGGK